MDDTFSVNRERFFTLTQNFPLVAPFNTSKGLESFDFGGGYERNLYFGTGLATTKAITRGLPFDFLGMLVGAEFSRRYLGITKIIHEISDTHAVENSFAAPETVKSIAAEQTNLISRMVKNLRIADTYECVLASEYQNDPRYTQLHQQVTEARPDAGHYFRYQWAGMAYLAAYKGVRLKVGWLTDDEPEAKHFDERRFDQGYNQLGLSPLSYVYLKSGRNFTPGRGRVSPYTSVEGEERVMLKPGEDAHSVLSEWVLNRKITKDTRQTVAHLANVVTAFESLYGRISGVGNVWTNAEENTQRQIVSIPSPPSLDVMGIKSVNLGKLADKINVILRDVFELNPHSPASSVAQRFEHGCVP
jgi:hypothetical protein